MKKANAFKYWIKILLLFIIWIVNESKKIYVIKEKNSLH